MTKKISTANSEDFKYDRSKDRKYQMYLDFTNLYGWASRQPLPHKNIRFCTEQELKELWAEIADGSFQSDRWNADADVGYFLEVKVETPDYLHSRMADYPFFPIKYVVCFFSHTRRSHLRFLRSRCSSGAVRVSYAGGIVMFRTRVRVHNV